MGNIVHFTKMHGAGNDYIYVDTTKYPVPDPENVSLRWSAPHTGIGSDGLVLIGRPTVGGADFSMRIFNADGSEALMCGNASRCIGKYLYEKGLTDKTEIRLQTLSGVKTLSLDVHDGKVESVSVDMLPPSLSDRALADTEDGSLRGAVLTACGREFKGTFVSMGNPHFVIFTDGVETLDIAAYGAVLEHDPVFPQRCNIEFAQLIGEGLIRVRVWERGSGITMACGTGACATAVAAAVTGLSGRSSRIVMDGGTLGVAWSEADDHVYLSGPAEFVFEGETEL